MKGCCYLLGEIRLAYKNLIRTNTLAYFAAMPVTMELSFNEDSQCQFYNIVFVTDDAAE
jgi:hypothetical protein